MAELAPRSYLFVPGNRPERIAKAIASGADAVLVDLEDAVPPEEKLAARAAVREWSAVGSGAVIVRINGVHTPWFADDMDLCRTLGLSTIMLPKVESDADLLICAELAPHLAILPLIESARGIYHAVAIAQHPSTVRLALGSLDLQVDLGLGGDDESMLYFRSQLVLASRLGHRPPPVDGVFPDIASHQSLHADTLRAKQLGFGAKLCIHPAQIATVNAAFLPTADELRWALRVMQAADLSRGAATKVDGQMIDRPVILRAQALIAEHERRGLRDP